MFPLESGTFTPNPRGYGPFLNADIFLGNHSRLCQAEGGVDKKDSRYNFSCIAVDLIHVPPGVEKEGVKRLAIGLVCSLSRVLPSCKFFLLTSQKNHNELSLLDSVNVCCDYVSNPEPRPQSSFSGLQKIYLQTRLRAVLTTPLIICFNCTLTGYYAAEWAKPPGRPIPEHFSERVSLERLSAITLGQPNRLRPKATLPIHVKDLNRKLQEVEPDRAARLGQVNKLTVLMQESEADRAARLDQINELTSLLKESETDRAARLEEINAINKKLGAIKSSLSWRITSPFRNFRYWLLKKESLNN